MLEDDYLLSIWRSKHLVQLTDSLRSTIHDAMNAEPVAGPVPGLAIAILDDEGISCENFGVRRFGENEPVTQATVFPAASLTKSLVAYLALMLVGQGILDLDTPLRHYLTQSYLPKEPRADLITMRHVLSHQCGFPNWRPKDKALAMHSAPGERFCYSGEGYNYLQHVLEQHCGQRLDVLLQERLLEPLDMSSSSLVWRPFMESRAVSGYGDNRSWEISHEDTPNSAYSLYTTIRDYARFVHILINANDMVPQSIRLSRELYEQIFIPQVQVGEWPTLFWGLGWGIETTTSGDLFWHWGAEAGYRNYVAFSTERHVGVTIFTNYEEGLYACRKIISRLDEPTLNVEHPAFGWLLPTEAWKEDGRRNTRPQKQ